MSKTAGSALDSEGFAEPAPNLTKVLTSTFPNNQESSNDIHISQQFINSIICFQGLIMDEIGI